MSLDGQERELDLHEALVMEKRANAALANGMTIQARRLFRIADALRRKPRRRHDD
jgi:hypothetical protein